MPSDIESLNLMPAIVEGYKADFSTAENVVGASSIAYGLRSIVISKRESLELAWKNTLLAGSMMHYSLQKEKVLQCIATLVNEGLGYTMKEINGKIFRKLDNKNYTLFNIEAEKERYIEILEGYYFRMHTDIHSTYWDIEIKTTGMPKSMWKEAAPYHLLQLNVNMGFNHNKLGFLWLIDRGATKWQGEYESHGGFYNSSSKTNKYLWVHYHMLYPHEFDQGLFTFTIAKLKRVFIALRDNTDVKELKCPEFVFECKDDCKDYCPNPIQKVKMDENDECIHCKEVIEMGTFGLIRNNQMYHYTDVKGHQHEACVQACKSAWEVDEDE